MREAKKKYGVGELRWRNGNIVTLKGVASMTFFIFSMSFEDFLSKSNV